MASVEGRFNAIARQLLADDAAIKRGAMLRSEGLKVDGRFFAFARDDELVVKLPAERVQELLASGRGRVFRSGGRTMREWVTLFPRDVRSCRSYVSEALAFARGR